jgi:Ca-activated chloride channel family protein
MIRFESPYFFLLLVFLILFFKKQKTSKGLLLLSHIPFAQFKSFNESSSYLVRYREVVLRSLSIGACVLLVTALARPQYGSSLERNFAGGRDIVLALDTSGSMQAMDFQLEGQEVDRLEVLKSVVSEFVSKRKTDRIGIVAFGTEVLSQCPLTTDHNAVRRVIQGLEIGMAGDGTAIGDALGISLKRLKDISGDSKVIILVTDGKSNVGALSPREAAEVAKALKIKIYTVGIGGPGRAPIKKRGMFGERLYLEMEYDEQSLKSIANITGGIYFKAKDTEQLQQIYQEIDKLEEVQHEQFQYVQYEERYLMFLALGFILLLIAEILRLTIFNVVPE